MPVHLNSSKQENCMATQPEFEEGIYLKDLADGAVLELQTQHHRYTLEKRAGSQLRISGHPKFCPEPVAIRIEGSINIPVSNLKPGFIGRGMHLIFKHPVYDNVTTSRIREIRKVA
jgi:hypothetical protein